MRRAGARILPLALVLAVLATLTIGYAGLGQGPRTVYIEVLAPAGLDLELVSVSVKAVLRGGGEALVYNTKLRPPEGLDRSALRLSPALPDPASIALEHGAEPRLLVVEVTGVTGRGEVLAEARALPYSGADRVRVWLSPEHSWVTSVPAEWQAKLLGRDGVCSWGLAWTVERVVDVAEELARTGSGLVVEAGGVYWVGVPLMILSSSGDSEGALLLYYELGGRIRLAVVSGAAENMTGKIAAGDWTGGLGGSLEVIGYSIDSRIIASSPSTQGPISGGETLAVYAYGRPVLRIMSLVLTAWCPDGVHTVRTGLERIDFYVEDFLASYEAAGYMVLEAGASTGADGILAGPLASYPQAYALKQLVIPGTPLGDGRLAPGENVPLRVVARHLAEQAGSCSTGLAIPAGLVASAALSRVDPALAPLAASLVLPVEAVWGSGPGVSGFIGNSEDAGGPVGLYAGFSGLEYRVDSWCLSCGSCAYRALVYYFVGG